MQYQNRLAYSDVLNTLKHSKNQHYQQIELDACRTFPDNATFKEIDGAEKLKRVLVAFSWITPSIGYTQSMNFLCGMLLLNVDEEQAFWILKACIEIVLPPDYYTKNMLGTMTDSNLVMELTETYLPKLHHLFKIHDIRLSMVLPRWLLCLFVNVLPNDITLRILDSFFIEGNKILIRACLALLKLNEQELLKCESPDQILSLLVNPEVNSIDAFFEHMYDRIWLRGLSKLKINDYRTHEKARLEALMTASEEKYNRRINRTYKVEYSDPDELSNEIRTHLLNDITRNLKSIPFRPRSWRRNQTDRVLIIENYIPEKSYSIIRSE